MKKFKNDTEKKESIAKILEALAKDVRANLYGEDGCGLNPEGYQLSDVLSDAIERFASEREKNKR